MACQSLYGLAIRAAEDKPSGPTRLPSISQLYLVPSPPASPIIPRADPFHSNHQSSGPRDASLRLPSISDLIKGASSLAQACPPPVFGPTPLPSPIGPSPSPYSASYSPVWTALPPRPQSVPPREFQDVLLHSASLGPRRASADCIYNSRHHIPTPSRSSACHRATPNRDRARRNSKAVYRRRGTPGSGTPPTSSARPYPHPDCDSNARTATTSPVEKRNNRPYTFEQEAFFIYHHVDLEMEWGLVVEAFMARWPELKRSVSGLECSYYRTNARIPATRPDGLLYLVTSEEEAQWRDGQAHVGGELVGEDGADDITNVSNKNTKQGNSKTKPFGYYKGAWYRTRECKVRKAVVSLMERFPEELVDPKHDWVREEHRVMARGLAERRRRQREEFLAGRRQEYWQGVQQKAKL